MENELSVASHSQLIDVRGTGWSKAALGYFGIPPEWFLGPSLSPRRLGPVRGIPELRGVSAVQVPGHDTACAFAAMPACAEGTDLYLSSGTWSLLGIENATPLLGAGALGARVSNERMGDGTYRPLKSCLGLWLLERVVLEFRSRPETPGAWRRLIAAASRARPPSRLLELSDKALFNPRSMRAAIDAHLGRRGAPPPRDLAGYTRLICDSLGKGHADAVAVFERLAGKAFKRILVVGGGSRNRLLCQATSDASGLPVASFSLEGAATGNIAAQLVALGAVRDHAAFRDAFSRQLRAEDFLPR
jgi:rhamnulokinase